MNTDTRKQIETALLTISGADLRAASIGLINNLGYQSGKTLDLDNTPDAVHAGNSPLYESEMEDTLELVRQFKDVLPCDD